MLIFSLAGLDLSLWLLAKAFFARSGGLFNALWLLC